MNPDMLHLFWIFGLVVLMLGVIGIYCVLKTYNLVRALIGLEILVKGVTLLLVVAGYVSGHGALAQSLVITLIVIEVVVMTVAVGVVFGIKGHTGSLDVRQIRNLKG
jgi:multisubunit Na+/H+ antiporter MnhC subunit